MTISFGLFYLFSNLLLLFIEDIVLLLNFAGKECCVEHQDKKKTSHKLGEVGLDAQLGNT